MTDIFRATINDSTTIHGGDWDIFINVHFELKLIEGENETRYNPSTRSDIEVLNIFQYDVSLINSANQSIPNIEGGEELLYLCNKDIDTLLNNYIDENFEYFENKLNN